MNDEIRIIPITTKKGLKTFIQFHYDLYRDHKFAIPFLRFDEMNTLDPKKILPLNSVKLNTSWRLTARLVS